MEFNINLNDPMEHLNCIPIESIRAARSRIEKYINKTPLLHLPLDGDTQGRKVITTGNHNCKHIYILCSYSLCIGVA